MILKPNGAPARKTVKDMTARPALFVFLMTGDPMALFSQHNMDLVCRSCKQPVLPVGNSPSDSTWRVECVCTEYRVSRQAAVRRSLESYH